MFILIVLLCIAMSAVRVGKGPYLGDLPKDSTSMSPKDYIESARASLSTIEGIPNIKDRLKEQIDGLENNQVPDFELLTKLEDIAVNKSDQDNFAAVGKTVRYIRQAFSLQRYEVQTAEISKKEQMNFARLLNSRIDPITKQGVRSKFNEPVGDYKATAKLIGSIESLLEIPFMMLQQGSFKNELVDLIKEGKYNKVADLTASYLLDSSKLVLTTMLGFMPKEIHNEVMVTFGGLSNAISTQMALVKVALDKVSKEFENGSHDFNRKLQSVFENLSHVSGQFSRIHAKTLKLIENMNGVISNQDEPYLFDPDNFEILDENGKAVLLPTVNFLGEVIKLGNDNATVTQSHTAGSNYTKRPVSNNFADQYSKTKGCPFHDKSSSSSFENFSRQYFAMFEALTKEIFGLKGS